MTGKLPTYIPPHLEGKVSDFRQDPSGSVSFAHDEAALGLGPEQSRRTIPLDQYKQTFDRDYRLRNFNESMTGQYAPRRATNRAQDFSQWVADTARSGFDWGTSSQGKAVGTAGLLAALAGGGLGAWLGKQQGEGVGSKALIGALLAGTATAGLTAYGQRNHNLRTAALGKQASDVVGQIVEAVTSDPSLGPADRAAMLRGAAAMSHNQRDELSDLIRTATGAGVGVLIMRFMSAKGLLPAMAGGIVGAMVGRSIGRSPKYNAMGQLSTASYR